MDSIGDQKSALFADLHGLRANAILFQDHKLSEREADGFFTSTAQKTFRSQGGYYAVVSESPVAPNRQRHGGAMVMVRTYDYKRVVDRFTDARGPGQYAAATLRGNNGVLITFISVYLTPTPGGESCQAAEQSRYIASHKGKFPAREPYALAVCDVVELVTERHRAGSVVVLGGDLQMGITDSSRPSSQLLQWHWEERVCPPSTEAGATPWNPGAQAVRAPAHYKGCVESSIDDIMLSASLTRAKYSGGYTEMGKEHPTNGLLGSACRHSTL